MPASLLVQLAGYVGLLILASWLMFISNTTGCASDRRRAVAAAATTLLLVLFAFGYDSRDWYTLLLPALIVSAPFLVVPLKQINSRSLFLPLLLVSLNFMPVHAETRPQLRLQAEPLLARLPTDALIITDGRDETVFTFWYLRFAEGQRPDTIIADANLLAFDWYRARLAGRHPDLTASLVADDLASLVYSVKAERPVCFVMLDPPRADCQN